MRQVVEALSVFDCEERKSGMTEIESLRKQVEEQKAEIAAVRLDASDLRKIMIGQSAKIAELTRQQDEAMKDAESYNKLCEYLIGPRTDLDNLIVAAKTKDEISAAIKESKP